MPVVLMFSRSTTVATVVAPHFVRIQATIAPAVVPTIIAPEIVPAIRVVREAVPTILVLWVCAPVGPLGLPPVHVLIVNIHAIAVISGLGGLVSRTLGRHDGAGAALLHEDVEEPAIGLSEIVSSDSLISLEVCLYFAVVEHGDDVVGTALLDELHLSNDSWVGAGEPAAEHLSANGSHDRLYISGGCAGGEVASNDSPARGLSSATDADATCALGSGRRLVVGSIGLLIRTEVLVEAAGTLDAGSGLGARELGDARCTGVVHMVKIVAPAGVVDAWLWDGRGGTLLCKDVNKLESLREG